ncbi:hypothetical protein CCMSSC00406_0005662 [Pleurotus cornucopiae]|uniref:Uncharacterized protein n=1 Tax=Pleurotus cornucopiae TaxID=5321 RepID=A0ACB7IUG6_PLECO|nr:hypothetical protein CCMSSC00406_0005662 [Pleurotus cornucopiae]
MQHFTQQQQNRSASSELWNPCHTLESGLILPGPQQVLMKSSADCTPSQHTFETLEASIHLPGSHNLASEAQKYFDAVTEPFVEFCGGIAIQSHTDRNQMEELGRHE